MGEDFTWVNFYMEFADKLLEYKNNRKELIDKIYNLFEEINVNIATLDRDEEGNSIRARDIDPFTVFALFNKGITWDKKRKIVNKIKEEFNLSSKAPNSFYGIPVVNNQKATFYSLPINLNHINNIWNLFEIALNDSKTPNEFISKYETVLKEKGIKWNLSMSLYWIRPNLFVNLDSRNREFLSNPNNLSEQTSQLVNPLKEAPNGETYLKICKEVKNALENSNFEYNTIPELSKYAYEDVTISPEDNSDKGVGDNDVPTTRYWLFAPGHQASKWEEFYKKGIMAIGWDGTNDLRKFNSKKKITKELQKLYNDKKSHSNDVLALWQFANEIQKGDIIFAKKGMNEIIGRGIVESDYEYDENRNQYKHVRKVKWTDKGNWYRDEKLAMKTLTDLTDYTETVDNINELIGDDISTVDNKYPQYNSEDFLNEVYISEENYDTLVSLLKNKKNLIIQGAPGVGKTFLAKRLAYSIMELKDKEKVKMIQFHQSYSYEDFIMGYRPSKDGFELKTGSFYDFCKKAEDDNENNYFFIIDEINRGNLSKIFGELFMLIENDKRGNKNKIQLLYSNELFSIPKNVHIIGLMNTADRSLAMIDYALRRRFAFFDLEPGFNSKGFKKYQEELDSDSFDNIINIMKELNNEIREDDTLGDGFRIGHSYFCNIEPDTVDDKLNFIINYEIIPLLKEYWFDEVDKVDTWSEKLKNCLE